jgi:hypothetical protein
MQKLSPANPPYRMRISACESRSRTPATRPCRYASSATRFALDEANRLVVAYVDRHASGVDVEEDWHVMGQRATISGTTRLKNVLLSADRIVLHGQPHENPQIFDGSLSEVRLSGPDPGRR